MKRKAIAAGITLVFFALVQPQELPALWITAALGIAFYEANLKAVEIAKRLARRKRTERDLMGRTYLKRWMEENFRAV